MAVKIKNLEHLDGKKVQHSTITAQFPGVFVNRKKNTGAIIFTSDTDPINGMHHIYAGGEHIAGGYGFPSTSVTDDLTYIQQSYNSIFDYFNKAYTYHSTGYTYISKFAYNIATYAMSAVNFHSYLNVKVDPDRNSILDGSYTFSFSKGVMTISHNQDASMSINTNTGNTYLFDRHLEYNNVGYIINTENNVSSEMQCYYTVHRLNVNIKQSSQASIATGGINVDNILGVSIVAIDGTGKNIYDNFIIRNSNNNELNGLANITNALKTNLTNNDSYVNIPIFKDYDTYCYINYSIGNNSKVELQTESVYYKWVSPIYSFKSTNIISPSNIPSMLKTASKYIINYSDRNTYTINTTINLGNEVVGSNTISRELLTYKGSDGTYHYYSQRFYIATPSYISNIKYYLSEDVSKKSDCAGGLAYTTYVKYLNDIYNIYMSDENCMNRNIRIDMDFLKSSSTDTTLFNLRNGNR